MGLLCVHAPASHAPRFPAAKAIGRIGAEAAVGIAEERDMRQLLSESKRSRHAITDLYDEERRTFLVQYPVWIVIGLGLFGVVAFAITGFLGVAKAPVDPQNPLPQLPVDEPFLQPWLLFLWLCALLITLQASIFRNKSLRGWLIATLIMSVLAIAVVGVYYFSKSLPDFIQELLRHHGFLLFLATHNGSYIILNFGLIALFWVDTIRRWVRRSHGLPPNPSVDIGFGPVGDTPENMPTMQELISGDFIAGAFLTLVLSLLFDFHVLSLFIHTDPQLTTCTVSWFGQCAQGATRLDPPTLSFLDLIQTLIYLPLGLIILAISATLSGFGAVGGVDASASVVDAPIQASEEQSSTAPIAEDVTTTVINTLKSALNRRLRLLLTNAAIALRTVGWPLLLFLATFGLAKTSTYIQTYLHSPKTLADVVSDVLPALGFGLVAILGIVISAALMLFRWRVVNNTLRFLGLIGFILLLVLWIFSLVLWGVNQFLLLTEALERHPFDPPGWSTIISLAALVVFGFIRLVAGSRGAQKQPRAQSPASSPVVVGAAMTSAETPAQSPQSAHTPEN
jgi:hypothetical protein